MRFYDTRIIGVIGFIIAGLFAWKCIYMMAQLMHVIR